MCPPTQFRVAYAINPWMDPSLPVDRRRARRQWDVLRRTYLGLGHEVAVIEPLPGQPDMVFAANGGLSVPGCVVGARFAYAERAAEGPAFLTWFRAAAATGGLPTTTAIVEPEHVNEGEGDLLVVGDIILAGHGFRTALAAHQEIHERTGLPVVSLQLVDPRFYHLDTALAVLDERTIAYYPGAFSSGSLAVLQRLFPDAILASEHDAAVLGLNAVSDGYNVVTSAAATDLVAELRQRGYRPLGVDLSEFAKAGGGVKCCTFELR
jgi:N-dimethylarginine dimethylaminohydrolase